MTEKGVVRPELEEAIEEIYSKRNELVHQGSHTGISRHHRAAAKIHTLLDFREKLDVEMKTWKPVEPNIHHESDYVRTQLIGYRSEFSLFDRLDHGDSIREVVDVFQGNREAKGTPPDRGLSLKYALRENKK